MRIGLEALIDTCDDTLEGLRDRALLYFAFASGGRRRSEVAAADLSDLRLIGSDRWPFSFREAPFPVSSRIRLFRLALA